MCVHVHKLRMYRQLGLVTSLPTICPYGTYFSSRRIQIMTDGKYNPLITYHDDLTIGLNQHVNRLVEKFSQMSLLSEDELADLKAQKGPVKYLLGVVHARKEKHDSQCFDELIKFMKGVQDARLSELADKMRTSQEDDVVLCVQAEQSQSSTVENCELNYVLNYLTWIIGKSCTYVYVMGLCYGQQPFMHFGFLFILNVCINQ